MILGVKHDTLYGNIGYLKLKNKSIEKILSSINDDVLICEMKNSTYSKAINELEKMVILMRKEMSVELYYDCYGLKNNAKKEISKSFFEKYSSISIDKNGYIKIILPPLFRNTEIRSHYIKTLVLSLFDTIKKENMRTIPGNDVCFFYQRTYKNESSVVVIDNDNMETHTITNAIAQELNISDGPKTTSFFYTSVQGDDDFITVRVIPKSLILDYINGDVD